MSHPPLAEALPSTSARRGLTTTAAALVAAWAVLFAPAILGSGQFLYRDAGRMHHPVKRWIAEELRRGHFPEWNPYAGLGVPVVAGGVDAPLHPFNALFLLFPFEAAFKAWVLLSVLLAGLGAASWARRLGHSTAGATATGLAFMLSGFVISSTDNPTYLTTLAGAPWLLAAAHAAVASGGARALLGVALASFVTAAGGDPMGWAVAVGLAAVQPFVWMEGGATRARGWRVAALGAVASLAAAPVILPIVACCRTPPVHRPSPRESTCAGTCTRCGSWSSGSPTSSAPPRAASGPRSSRPTPGTR